MTTIEPPHTTTAAPSIRATDRVIGLATIIGPLLGVASSIAWAADAAEPRAILQFWAMIGFAFVFVGIARRLEPRSAVAAATVLVLGLVGCAGGIAYATEAAFVEYFDIERLNDRETAATFLMLRLPGITFPLSLLASAALLWRHQLVGVRHAGLLALGAVGFPLSRIPEIPALAIAADLLLAAAVVPLGLAAARPARRA